MAMNHDSDEALALRLKALGHPARLQLVRSIARSSPCACGELVPATGLAQATTSQHLKILREAGLVTAHGQSRRCCYSVNADLVADTLKALGSLCSSEQT